MLYQYFDSQDNQLQAEIDFYEKRIAKNLSLDDLKTLERLRIKREVLIKVFSDLASFAVDFF